MADDDICGAICCVCLIIAVVGGMITGDYYGAGQAAAGLFWAIIIIILITAGIVAVYNWIKKKASSYNSTQPPEGNSGELSNMTPQPVIPVQTRINPTGASSMSQFCIHCGNSVLKSQNFCENCGKNPDK